MDVANQLERIGLGVLVFVIGDAAVGRRTKIADHHVFVGPLAPFVALAVDDGVASVLRGDQDRIVGQFDQHQVDRMLRGAVGVDRLDGRQRADEVDRRDAVGNAIGE